MKFEIQSQISEIYGYQKHKPGSPKQKGSHFDKDMQVLKKWYTFLT